MCDSKPAGQNNKPKTKHMKQNGRLQQVGVAPPTRTKALLSEKKNPAFLVF